MRSETIHGKLEVRGLCGTVYCRVALPEPIFVEARLSYPICWCGRWAVESSGRHYIQSGRQLLLSMSMSLPSDVAALARALRTIGVGALVREDLRERVIAAS